MKRDWKTPGLVILTKGRPEEKVLGICKVNSPNAVGTGPSSNYDKCSNGNKSQNCNACTGEGGGTAGS